MRYETEDCNFFKTDAGVPQEDGLSANEFTSYLLKALYKENNDHTCKKSYDHNLSKLSSISSI